MFRTELGVSVGPVFSSKTSSQIRISVELTDSVEFVSVAFAGIQSNTRIRKILWSLQKISNFQMFIKIGHFEIYHFKNWWIEIKGHFGIDYLENESVEKKDHFEKRWLRKYVTWKLVTWHRRSLRNRVLRKGVTSKLIYSKMGHWNKKIGHFGNMWVTN